jgi:hypothetical protein
VKIAALASGIQRTEQPAAAEQVQIPEVVLANVGVCGLLSAHGYHVERTLTFLDAWGCGVRGAGQRMPCLIPRWTDPVASDHKGPLTQIPYPTR